MRNALFGNQATTKEDDKAVHEGLQALMLWTVQSGGRIANYLGDSELSRFCKETEAKLLKSILPAVVES